MRGSFARFASSLGGLGGSYRTLPQRADGAFEQRAAGFAQRRTDRVQRVVRLFEELANTRFDAVFGARGLHRLHDRVDIARRPELRTGRIANELGDERSALA